MVVACSDHVARGRSGGFVQACHGKKWPMEKLAVGDSVLLYSPNVTFGDKSAKNKLHEFTALGVVRDEAVYMAPEDQYKAWRRNIVFDKSVKAVAVKPLVDQLSFIQDKTHWGRIRCFGVHPRAELVCGRCRVPERVS